MIIECIFIGYIMMYEARHDQYLWKNIQDICIGDPLTSLMIGLVCKNCYKNYKLLQSVDKTHHQTRLVKAEQLATKYHALNALILLHTQFHVPMNVFDSDVDIDVFNRRLDIFNYKVHTLAQHPTVLETIMFRLLGPIASWGVISLNTIECFNITAGLYSANPNRLFTIGHMPTGIEIINIRPIHANNGVGISYKVYDLITLFIIIACIYTPFTGDTTPLIDIKNKLSSGNLRRINNSHIKYIISHKTAKDEHIVTAARFINDIVMEYGTAVNYVDGEVYNVQHHHENLFEMFVNETEQRFGAVYKERVNRLKDLLSIEYEAWYTMNINPIMHEFTSMSISDRNGRSSPSWQITGSTYDAEMEAINDFNTYGAAEYDYTEY